MGFRNEYREAKQAGMGVSAWIIVIIVISALAGILVQWLGMFGSVATAPARVVEKTMRTDNIISNYEWYHDANGKYKSRIAQITSKKKDLSDPANDSQEKNRLRIELSAMQQSCRELANQYNANAIKTNKSIFMGREAPETLNAQLCE